MRLFIASPVVLRDYAAIRTDFGSVLEGRWVPERNLHLTWVFLGEVDDPRPIREKLATLAPLDTEVPVGSLGHFGRPPHLLFAGADAPILYDKAREVRAAGFDPGRFRPHITLCRIKTVQNSQRYNDLLTRYRYKPLGTILPAIHLYRSILTPSGPIYRPFPSETDEPEADHGSGV